MKEIKYLEVDGLLYPDLNMLSQKKTQLTKFGRMRLNYLKKYRPIFFTNLLVSGELNDYLLKFDDNVNEIYDVLIEQYKKKMNVTERLKEKDQMNWIYEMNNIQNEVMEFIKVNYLYN